MKRALIVRRVAFRAHWIAGLLAGLVLAVVGATGAPYAFEAEILVALNPHPEVAVASLPMPLFFVAGIWIWPLRRRTAKRNLPFPAGGPLRSAA